MILTERSGAGVASGGAFDGLRQMAPAAVGVLPFATMIGVAIGESPLSNGIGFVGGLVVAGGSAHLAATSSITAGAGLLATVAVALMVNARGLIYGAALAPVLNRQPRWFRWVAAYGLVDQMYALVSAIGHRDARYVRAFYLTALVVLWSAYMTGVGAGIVLGPIVPASVPLEMAIPIMFLALLVPSLGTRPSHVAVLVGMAVAVMGAGLPAGLGLIAGIVAGTVAGAVSEGNRGA